MLSSTDVVHDILLVLCFGKACLDREVGLTTVSSSGACSGVQTFHPTKDKLLETRQPSSIEPLQEAGVLEAAVWPAAATLHCSLLCRYPH